MEGFGIERREGERGGQIGAGWAGAWQSGSSAVVVLVA